MGEFSANFMDEVSCASSNLRKYMYVINVCLCSLYWHKIEGCPLHSNWVESFIYRPTRSYIKVNMATRWTIRQALMLLWFKDLMNVTKEAIIHRPNISTLLSSAFIRGDPNAATRGHFIPSLLSCLFFWWGVNRRQVINLPAQRNNSLLILTTLFAIKSL